nr:hypothetical protein HK105_000907 [Polyrhizophydium stewartii]
MSALGAALTPLAVHRASTDTASHGCPHLGAIKAAALAASASAGAAPGAAGAAAAATAASAAAQLFDSYRSCVRYSLMFRNRFQLHVHKKGKEFRAMVAVDDDEAVSANAAAVASAGGGSAMDFVHCNIYCSKCKDYVYDLDFERVLHSERSRIDIIISRIKEPNHRRTMHKEWTPSPEEMQLIRSNSTLQRCSGLRGLRNMGSTCFMNTILQTFIHNPLLRAHFLSDRHDRLMCTQKDSPCLACEMDDLFRQFYNGQTSPYGPTSFLYAMWMSQKHLAGYQQQDAHEFFISVLNEIHNNCTGRAQTANDVLSPCKCIIHQVFGGVLQSDVTCLKCGNVTTAWDPILDISLDIKPTSKLPKKPARKLAGAAAASAAAAQAAAVAAALASGLPPPPPPPWNAAYSPDDDPKSNEPYSLVECLEGFTLPEKLGPNQYTCASCGNTFQEATKQLSMKRLPPVLAIQLKVLSPVYVTNRAQGMWLKMMTHATQRFEHSATTSTKIDTFVRVPPELDMTPHTTRSVKLRAKLRASRKDSASRKIPLRGIAGFDTMTDGIPTYKYSLFAIVNHEGKIDTGHYKAFAKCRDQWFMFDDHSVTVTTQKTALESNGYMCFYIHDNAEYSPQAVVEASDVTSDSSES